MQALYSDIDLNMNFKEVMRHADQLCLEKVESLWERWPSLRKSPGTYASLKAIHKAMFNGIFSFAGIARHINLSKNGFPFAYAYVVNECAQKCEQMPQGTFDEIVDKYVEMNVVHPFREGNGRTTRLWLDAILEKELQTRVAWDVIEKDDYMNAVIESTTQNSLRLKALLHGYLLDKKDLDSKSVFISCVESSMKYEHF